MKSNIKKWLALTLLIIIALSVTVFAEESQVFEGKKYQYLKNKELFKDIKINGKTIYFIETEKSVNHRKIKIAENKTEYNKYKKQGYVAVYTYIQNGKKHWGMQNPKDFHPVGYKGSAGTSLLSVLNVDDNYDGYLAYCIDRYTYTEAGMDYTGHYLESVAHITQHQVQNNNASHLRAIVNNSYPQKNRSQIRTAAQRYFINNLSKYPGKKLVSPKDGSLSIDNVIGTLNSIDDKDIISATQMAIWHYANGIEANEDHYFYKGAKEDQKRIRLLYEYFINLTPVTNEVVDVEGVTINIDDPETKIVGEDTISTFNVTFNGIPNSDNFNYEFDTKGQVDTKVVDYEEIERTSNKRVVKVTVKALESNLNYGLGVKLKHRVKAAAAFIPEKRKNSQTLVAALNPVDVVLKSTTKEGVYVPNTYSLGNRVWFDGYQGDADQDGLQEVVNSEQVTMTQKVDNKNNYSDQGIAGVTVELLNASGTVLDTKITDKNGFYLFSGLKAGEYKVRFSGKVLKQYAGVVKSNQGNDDAKDSDKELAEDGSYTTALYNLSGHEQYVNLTADLGLYKINKFKLGDRVWKDSNKNGLQDAGEEGVAGVTVTLKDKDGQEQTTTTDAQGKYLFENLINGDYNVTFSNLPTDYVATVTSVGSDVEVDSNGMTTDGKDYTGSTTIADKDNLSLDLGIYEVNYYSLGNRVWIDNGDNVQLSTNPMDSIYATATTAAIDIPNSTTSGAIDLTEITATIVNADGTTLVRKDSDGNVLPNTINLEADGTYLFERLENGHYVVTFNNLPENYSLVEDNATTADKDSDPKKPEVADGQTADTHTEKWSASAEGIIRNADNLNLDMGIIYYTKSAPKPADKYYQIGDFVWFDKNKNGVQDDDEEGVNGVKVRLTNPDGSITETTTVDGYYNFVNLVNGEYKVTFDEITLPGDYEVTTSNAGDNDEKDSDGLVVIVDLNDGDDLSIDLGIVEKEVVPEPEPEPEPVPVYSIGDYVWHDSNNNGIQDDGEVGIAGVNVILIDLDHGTKQETTTDANGHYQFTDLVNGNYLVEFKDIPAEYKVTKTEEGADTNKDSNGLLSKITIQDADRNDIDLGLYKAEDVVVEPDPDPIKPKTFAIGDYVWLDENKNGLQDDSEKPLENVGVILLDKDGQELTRTFTNQKGYYEFADLVNGDYTVKFVLPDGYEVTKQDAAGLANADELDSDGLVVNVKIEDDNDWTIDLGLVKSEVVQPEPEKNYKLGDFVWYDDNNNGVQDAGEKGVENVIVKLFDKDGTEINKTSTDKDGHYQFTDLKNGDYTVKFFNLPDGYEVTAENKGDDAKDSDGLEESVTIADQDDMTIDLGIYQTPVTPEPEAPKKYNLGDYVWLDANKNGLQDADEDAVAGVKVTLYNDKDEIIARTFTDEDGHYQFTDLENGTYKVKFEKPEAYSATESNVGNDEGKDSDGLIVFTEIKDGDNDTVDLGLFKDEVVINKYNLGDYVWLDENKNGIQDDNEKGIAGVKVELYNDEHKLIDETSTDENGKYLFKGLVDGSYYVIFSKPDGYYVTKSNVGDDAKDSDGLTVIAIIKTADNLSLDLGLVKEEVVLPEPEKTYKLGDYVWVDANKNGIQDQGEVAAKAVKVELFDANNNKVGETVTDDKGHYQFDNLANGIYTVSFTLPDGYLETVENAGNDDNKDSDGLVVVAVINDSDNFSVDLGIIEAPKAVYSIGNYVWLDKNKNGLQDVEDEAMNNVIVELYNQDLKLIGKTVTDEKGYYQFNGLENGVYTVKFIKPDGYQETIKNVANNQNDSRDSDGLVVLVKLVDADDMTIDLGLVKKQNQVTPQPEPTKPTPNPEEKPDPGVDRPAPTPDSEPSEPEPTDPEVVDPELVDSEPVNPTLVDSEPVNPTPVDPEPVNPTLVNPEPVNPTPVNLEPVDSTPEAVKVVNPVKTIAEFPKESKIVNPTDLPLGKVKVFAVVDDAGNKIAVIRVEDDGSFAILDDDVNPLGTVKLNSDGEVELVDLVDLNIPLNNAGVLPKTGETAPQLLQLFGLLVIALGYALNKKD